MSLDDKPDVVEMIYDEHVPRNSLVEPSGISFDDEAGEAKCEAVDSAMQTFGKAARRLKQAEAEFKAAQAAYVEAVSALSNAVTS